MTLLYDWLKKSAKAQGNSKALVYRDNYLSWRGLLHRVDRRAQEFRAMGIKEGAWVGLMLGNVPDFVILALALSKLKAAVIPIDPTTGSRELELILAAAPLRALVTRPRGSEGGVVSPGLPGTPSPTARSRSSKSAPQPPEVDEADVPEIRRRLQGTLLTCSVFKRSNPDYGVKALAVMFTADSLGDPKGVLRTASNIESATKNIVEALDIDQETRLLTAVPLFHAYGWDLGLLPVLYTGATMFLEEEISARRVAKLLREHTIDVLPGTPTMYSELSRLPTAKALKVKKPRYLSSGSRLDPEVAQSFAEKYSIKVISCYHTTETGAIALDRTAKSPMSVGKPIGGIDVRITDKDGVKLATGKKGLVWVKGMSLSPRAIGPFQEDAAKSTEKLVSIGTMDRDGWYRTGDMGKLDSSGKLSLTGREDDVVKVEGKRVALGEVEGCLESFPKVKAAQARVVTDPLTGAMVVARVVTKASCEAEEIIDHCARNLAPYKVPRRIEFCDRI